MAGRLGRMVGRGEEVDGKGQGKRKCLQLWSCGQATEKGVRKKLLVAKQ